MWLYRSFETGGKTMKHFKYSIRKISKSGDVFLIKEFNKLQNAFVFWKIRALSEKNCKVVLIESSAGYPNRKEIVLHDSDTFVF
jgi:hypothetical protein